MNAGNTVWVRMLFVLAVMVGAGQALAQHQARNAWGEATAAKLKPFVPETAPGLVDRMPWDRQEEFPQWDFGCTTEGCHNFLALTVWRTWRIADPALIQQVEATGKQVEAEFPLLLQQLQAMGKRMQESMKRIEELSRQGKHQEAMKLGESLANDPEQKRLDAKRKELDRRVPDLQAKARSVRFSVEANHTPDTWYEAPRQIGTLNGYPLYRVALSDRAYGATPEAVILLAYLGPAGFKNPIVPSEKVRTEVRTILVRVQLRTTPGTVKDDEVLIRQMLEKVNVAGLAKLLTPEGR